MLQRAGRLQITTCETREIFLSNKFNSGDEDPTGKLPIGNKYYTKVAKVTEGEMNIPKNHI